MKSWTRYFWLLCLHFLISIISYGQLTVVDGFDYPINTPNGIGWNCKQDIAKQDIDYNKSYGGYHTGEDWSKTDGCYNNEVYAIANGKVVHAETGGGCWLKVIMIEHTLPNGEKFISLYGHLLSMNCPILKKSLSVGDIVKKGWEIGRIGNPPCGGPHLHFEIRNKNHKSILTRGKGYLSIIPSQILGFEDPSAFIDANRYGNIGIGEFNKSFVEGPSISIEIWKSYIKNGGWEKIGEPFSNKEGGRFVHQLPSDFLNQSGAIYIQDFQNSLNEITSICYNIEIKKAFLLKGCIGFLWWEKSNPDNIASLPYQNYLGLPISDEEVSDDSDFKIMQKFKYGTVYWRPDCLDGKDNVKFVFKVQQHKNGCLACQPKTDYIGCSCHQNSFTKSASLLPDCDQLFSAPYLQKTSWDFGNEETEGWTARNASDLGFVENWYWMIDPQKDPDPISGSGIVSPPFLSAVNTDLYNQVELRAACKSQFMKTIQLHLLIDGEWKPPVMMNCISPEASQLPNNQCVYKGDIPYSGQIQQFRIDFIEGSDLIDDQIFIDYVKFVEGLNPVPTLLASFTSDVQYGKFPLTVNFVNTSQTKSVSSPLTYDWDFGDGITSGEQSPTYIYTKPGEYSVSLKISSGIYNNTVVQSKYIQVFESSPVVNLEYFFDIDPGQGKGIPINGAPGEDFSQSFDLNYGDFSEGYHTLFIRAKDGYGKWGTVASKPFYALHIDDIPYITQMEYFFDNDPGFGNGNLIATDYDTWEENSFLLDYSQLNEGYHTLFVRAKDSFGTWSLVATKEFYSLHANDVQYITQMEYFFDSDPGFGLGKPVTVSNNTVEEQNVILDFSGLTEGYHSLFVRTKDNLGKWGTITSKPFYRITDSNPVNITNVEYYIDSDPGIGKATNEKVNPTLMLQHNVFLDLNFLNQGNHKLGIRVKNGYLNWSDTKLQSFTYKSSPIANAGSNQFVDEGSSVILDGIGSYDPDGDILTFKWTAPAGITLSSTTVAKPTFTAPEVTSNTNYTFSLVVNDGTVDSPVDQVVITVKNVNKAPVANAGIYQSVNEGTTVSLDGSASSDPDGTPLTYKWIVPAGITLSSTTSAKLTFTIPEVSSNTNYTFSLVVNDGTIDSPVDQVIITVRNVNKSPVANAGADQSINEGATVSLDGSASSDPDGNLLTYKWTAPAGIPLSSTTVAKPSFTAPEVSANTNYTFSLVVNDGTMDSPVDQVVITVQNVNKAPIAIAGSDQSVNEGTTFTLDGSASFDLDENLLTFKWTTPPGITLNSTTVSNPIFTAPEVSKDTPYTFSLVVNDGTVDSPVDQVEITVKRVNKAPVANAGTYQNVNEGTAFTLDGSQSSDPDNDLLTYQWIAPRGISLSSTTIANPTFTTPEVKKDSTITFSLEVFDGIENSNPATINITVLNVIKVGISNFDSPLFKIYPNPTTGMVTLEFRQNLGKETSVSVSNMMGAEVFRKEVNEVPKLQIDLFTQISGIYVLKVTTDNHQYISKIVLRK